LTHAYFSDISNLSSLMSWIYNHTKFK